MPRRVAKKPRAILRRVEERFKRLPDGLYFSGLLPLLSRLPPRFGYAAARLAGGAIGRNFPDHRQLVEDRLERHLSAAVRKGRSSREIAAEFYRVMAAEDLDAYLYPRWNRDNIERYFRFEGLEHLDDQVERGEGALLVTAHLGAVCAAVVALGALKYPVTHLAREYPEDDSLPPAFHAFALRKVRWMQEKFVQPMIFAGAPDNPEGKARAVMETAAALERGRFVSMAMDIPPFRVSQGVRVSFLGRPCVFPANFVQIAARCGVPLIPYFTHRRARQTWKHQLTVQAPIRPTGDPAADLQACVERLEAAVLAHPEQWFAWDSIDHFLAG